MNEVWKPVPGYPFDASSEGRVRRAADGRLIAQGADRNGYRFVRYWVDGRCRSAMVGPLVCLAFHGPRPTPGAQADHEDEDRANNREWNLRWLTRRANHARARTVAGRTFPNRPTENLARGENHRCAKLNVAAVVAIRSTYRRGSREFGLPALARRFGVTPQTIRAALIGMNWKGVADEAA